MEHGGGEVADPGDDVDLTTDSVRSDETDGHNNNQDGRPRNCVAYKERPENLHQLVLLPVVTVVLLPLVASSARPVAIVERPSPVVTLQELVHKPVRPETANGDGYDGEQGLHRYVRHVVVILEPRIEINPPETRDAGTETEIELDLSEPYHGGQSKAGSDHPNSDHQGNDLLLTHDLLVIEWLIKE